MDDQAASSTLRRFRSLFEGAAVAGLTDGQLLERFATGRGLVSEAAFEALLIRHGPMVLGVCRRTLADPNDVDDAFQATFLVLVRKARSVRVDDSLGRWLYGVSRKVASRAKVNATKRRTTGLAEAAGLASSTVAPHVRDLAEVLDDELSRLPEPYRSAVTLCDLAGLTLEEAARDLRCPVGTIKSRLARGRDRLRTRLIGRGVAPAAILIGRGTPAPAALVEATIRAASTYVATGVMSAGVVPATVMILAEGVIQAMTWTKWKVIGAVVMSFCIAATGAGLAAQQPGEGKPVGVVEKRISLAGGAYDLKMAAKLDERVSVHLKESPLGEVIAVLEQISGLKIAFDPEAVDRDKWAKEHRASLDVDDVTLRTALTLVLYPARLIYRQKDEGLVIMAGHPAQTSRNSTDWLDQELMRLRERMETERLKNESPDEAAIKKLAEDFAEVEEAVSKVIRLEMSYRGKTVAEVEPIARQAFALAKKVLDKPGAGPYGDSRMANDPMKTKRPPREGRKISLPSYVVEAPDIIRVEVLESLPGRPIEGEYLVQPDGTISLGFYGDLQISGLTVSEIKEKIILHLRDQLSDEVLGLFHIDQDTGKPIEVAPVHSNRVFVQVGSYNSKVYYVQGDVGTPGRLPSTGNDTVLDAINYAGGVIGPWRKAKIRVVRPSKEGEPDQVLTVDLQAIIEKGDGATNYQLMPRDRLVVEGEPPVPAQEARMREMERKLELILQKLDDLKKP